MNEAERKRFQQLCQSIIDEQDHARLMQFVRELNDLLEAKEKRLKSRSDKQT